MHFTAKRTVDTVTVEMGIDEAERLLTILREVKDETSWAQYSVMDDIGTMSDVLESSGEVRSPSPLYHAEVEYTEKGVVLVLRNKI